MKSMAMPLVYIRIFSRELDLELFLNNKCFDLHFIKGFDTYDIFNIICNRLNEHCFILVYRI